MLRKKAIIMLKNNLFKLSLLAFSVLGIVGCSSADPSIEQKEDTNYFECGDIISHGVQLKRLLTGVDENDHPYQTFSYVTVPADAALPDIDISSSFVGGGSCSSYMTIQHDSSNKNVKLTCLQPFSTLINVHLEAHYNSSCYADITIHYLPKYSQTINKTLYFYDSGNDISYGLRSTTPYEDAFDFSVSVNTEGVSSNPRDLATISEVIHGTKIDGTMYQNPKSGVCASIMSAQESTSFYNDSRYPNIFSQSVSNVFSSTGFDLLFPNLLASPFICKYSGSQDIYVQSRIRTNIKEYLNKHDLSSSLDFTTYSATDLITAINQFLSDNSVIYVPVYNISFGVIDSQYEYGQQGYFSSDVSVSYENSETEVIDFSYGIFETAVVKTFNTYSLTEFSFDTITLEESSLSF